MAAPPAVAWSAPAAAAWLQYLLPLLGGAGSLAFLFAVPGPRHPLLVAAVAGTAVASLALGVGLRLVERRTARRARRRERSRYLAHLARVAAAADHLAADQLATADHLHPDPPRLWTLVCRAERLWERRPADDDFLTVRVGRGPVPLHTPVRLDAAGGPLVERDAGLLAAAEALARRAGWLPQAPVTVPLRRLGVLALTGPRDRIRALARALLCQLAALHAPDDLRILAAFPPAALPAWEWLMRVYTIYLLALGALSCGNDLMDRSLLPFGRSTMEPRHRTDVRAWRTNLSHRVCCHSGQQLPNNHTCGERCREFPDCISIPIDVVFQLIEVDEHTRAAEREATRRIDVLQSMHDAVVTGLAAQVTATPPGNGS